MTPPGDPLKFGFGDAINRLFLKHAQNYPDLEERIQAAIAEEAPLTVTPIWIKKSKNGHVTRGAKVTVQVEDVSGKTTMFEAMFIKGNDRRGIVRVIHGVYTEKDASQFCVDYAAQPEGQGGKP